MRTRGLSTVYPIMLFGAHGFHHSAGQGGTTVYPAPILSVTCYAYVMYIAATSATTVAVTSITLLIHDLKAYIV